MFFGVVDHQTQNGPCLDCPNPTDPRNKNKTTREIFTGKRFWNESLDRINEIKNNKIYPWNNDSYPWYKEFLWNVYEAIGWVGDRIIYGINPYHDSLIHPWGYHKETHREFFYKNRKQYLPHLINL